MPQVSIASLSNPSCEFWYHMFGATMGTLALQEFDGITWNTIWSTTGNQGAAWLMANVPLTGGSTATLRFHYTRGSNWTGDAAVDDVRICG